MIAPRIGLIGDIGATNARFALVRPDANMTPARTYRTSDFPTLTDAVAAYLGEESPPASPTEAVLAVAGPVTNDEVAFTNHPWSFSINTIRTQLGFDRLRVINDFEANALAVPYLDVSDRLQIGGGAPVADAPVGLLGPGTGLGMSVLVPADGGTPLQSEGGHVTMAPADAQESAILDLMRRRYDHVSAERVLSGAGLVNLYNALCELAGKPAASFTPAQITDPRTWNEDPRTREATTLFCAMLGTVAGNLALTLGARGGIYIAGGIVPKLGSIFAESAFRTRFESKGRLRGYLAAIPTYVITRPVPALLGAAKLLERAW